MLEYSLNVMGSEWIIIIFVALIVLLGTNRLPEVTKKFGKAVGEYNKAKNDVQKQFNDLTNSNLEVTGPVENEKQKLEAIAKSIGVNPENKTEEELRKIISTRIGESSKFSKGQEKTGS